MAAEGSALAWRVPVRALGSAWAPRGLLPGRASPPCLQLSHFVDLLLLNLCFFPLAAMKADRRRLKGEKSDLVSQMQQLYSTLESREEQLRDFIRNYEQHRKVRGGGGGKAGKGEAPHGAGGCGRQEDPAAPRIPQGSSAAVPSRSLQGPPVKSRAPLAPVPGKLEGLKIGHWFRGSA